MVYFGVEDTAAAMQLGLEAAEEVSKAFIQPIKLEFEKVGRVVGEGAEVGASQLTRSCLQSGAGGWRWAVNGACLPAAPLPASTQPSAITLRLTPLAPSPPQVYNPYLLISKKR